MALRLNKQDKDMLYSFFDYYFYFNDVNETTKLKSKHKLATEIVDFFVYIRGYDRESLIILVENEIPGYFLYTSGKPNYFDELKKNEPAKIPATAFQGMIKRDASLGSLTASKWLRQAEQGWPDLLATMTFEPPIYDGGGTKKNKSKKNKLKINKTKKK